MHTTVTLVSRSSVRQSRAHQVQAMELRRRLQSAKAVPHGLALVTDPATVRCVPVDADALWNFLEDLQYAKQAETQHLVCFVKH